MIVCSTDITDNDHVVDVIERMSPSHTSSHTSSYTKSHVTSTIKKKIVL